MATKLFLVFLLAATLALPAFSQTFGEITGVVTDPSGAVIGGATITVTNPQTNFTRSATTNDTGNYSFPALLPGVYNVRAEISGFQSEARNSVELQVQQTARIDFRLKVGALTETVEVSAGAPLLNTENATIGTVIEQKRIQDLPLNGRSFLSLIALSPNVITGQTAAGGYAAVRGGSDRGSVSISIAGLRREFVNYTLDGVSNTDVDFNTYAFLPSIDALQEFKVQTGVYSAEFGHEAAQVNVSTKSGTNAYHGAVFEFLRNNALDARPYAFTSQVPVSAPFKWNQYGFMLGGPVQIGKVFNGKDRLFFMSNYEGFKLRNQTQQVFSVPSAAMRRGNFSELLPARVIKDPLNNNQTFPGNIIPAQRLNPISLGLLEFYPLPNVAGAGLVDNYLALLNSPTDKDQFTQRIDFMESMKSSWFGRYSWQDELKVNPGFYKNAVTVNNNIKQVVISNTRIFSPTLVNEFRTGYLGFHNILLTENAYKRNVIKELNIPFLDPQPIAWGSPVVSIVGFAGFGDNNQGPFAANDHTFQWIDNVSWIRGSHSIKFGGEIRRDRYNLSGNPSLRGSLTVQDQATGYGFADYMLGYPNLTGQSVGIATAQLRRTNQAYYITDNWKARPNLTIEAGLRYEYTPAWSSRSDSMVNLIMPKLIFEPTGPVADPADHPYFARDCAAYGQTDFYYPGSIVRFNPAVQVKCVSGLGTSLVRNDLTNWAPRLGMAWSPSEKWTVRLGAGVFYVQDQGNSFWDAARNLAGPQISVNANVETHDLTFQKPFPTGPTVCGVPSPPYICVSSPVPFGNDPDRRTPYIVQYELNLQRQLSNSTVLEIGYLGSQGRRLQALMNFNNSIQGPGSIASRASFPEFNKLQNIMGLARSNYNSGTVKLTRRLSKGLSFLAGYTFSKSLDDRSGTNPQNGAETIRTLKIGYCISCEHGPSDFDSRHRFVTSVLYELPIGKGKRFLNRGIGSSILGGWQLNSIVAKSTGFPVDIVTGVNQCNCINAFGDRPNVVPGVSWKLDHPTTDQWFNIQAFQLEPFGTYGNAGRNTVVSPGVFSWDFSTLKNFTFTERSYLQFRFECFNCANHPNFADPGNRLGANRRNAADIPIPGTGNFGRISATRPGFDMRQLQFGLKVIF